MDWQHEKHSWPNSHLSRFVDLAGTQWHVQRTGDGPGILLLHGSGATTHSFEGLMAGLSDKFEVFAPDLPGHGFSSTIRGKRSSLNNISQALSKLLMHEAFEPAFIVGHSAGAAIAVNMIAENHLDTKGIVSVNGAFYPFAGFARQLFPAIAKLLFLNPFVPRIFAMSAGDKERVQRLIRSTGSNLTEQQMNYYARAFVSSRHVEGTLAMMANWELDDMDKKLKNMPVPLLQIIGEKDGTIDPAASLKTAKTVPNGERISLADGGHLVHEENPRLVAKYIVEFAARCIANDANDTCAN
ncbi:MAG: alpha/beta fold hydrolase BchO [Pseudomonadota bacterium]